MKMCKFLLLITALLVIPAYATDLPVHPKKTVPAKPGGTAYLTNKTVLLRK